MHSRLGTVPVEALRIAIVGCGGVGGVTAAHLAEAGCAVTAITHNPEIAAAITAHGLNAAIEDTVRIAKIEAVASADRLPADAPPFDALLVATPPNAAADAVRGALPVLADDAPVVCLPNGLIEERLLEVVPAERLIGAIVAFGATMAGPGRVRQTSSGGLTVGRLPQSQIADDTHLAGAIDLLGRVGPVQPTDNLRGARWSKLAINCAISALGAVGGEKLGVLMRHRFIRRIALETMSEVVAIANAEDIRLKKVAGTLDLDWLALTPNERLRSGSPGLVAKHAVLLAVGTKYRRMRSSLLLAIERGRMPAIDQLNGEITARSGRHGIPTPVNQALQDAVHRVARGEAKPSIETLRELFEETRPVLRQLQLAA